MSNNIFSLSFNIYNNIENQFSDIADKLMNQAVLIVDDDRFRIIDIEFYLFDAESHPDPFVHCHPKQKTSMQWYFHESGNGMDLTFGSNEFYGGILIKGIHSLNNDIKIIGHPFKTMNALLQSIKSANSNGTQRLQLINNKFDDIIIPVKAERKNLCIHEKITIKFHDDIYAIIFNQNEKKIFEEIYPKRNKEFYKRRGDIKGAVKNLFINQISLYRKFKEIPYRFFCNNIFEN